MARQSSNTPLLCSCSYSLLCWPIWSMYVHLQEWTSSYVIPWMRLLLRTLQLVGNFWQLGIIVQCTQSQAAIFLGHFINYMARHLPTHTSGCSDNYYASNMVHSVQSRWLLSRSFQKLVHSDPSKDNMVAMTLQFNHCNILRWNLFGHLYLGFNVMNRMPNNNSSCKGLSQETLLSNTASPDIAT